ncbi:hypothetical protein D1B33_03490 [Lysinibacillus yapensis]|uniref:SH3b domain-containing protein n=1 Tax=Ureibacillus yapensis TaxID=2304605 RepID=A0A396SFU9_9BACL|nr:dynamin family protein [Lysinibacillus yapensis]RHW39922.1 hypothetical protein D1B33_03490 [Lysinibacillus yapensis]
MSFDKVMNSMLNSLREEESFSKLVSSLERLLVHWHDPVRLLVMGEFKSGKSTLINTLLRDKVLVSGAVPTTAIATYLRFGEKDTYIEVVYETGIIEQLTVDQLTRLTSERDREGKQLREKIHHINLYIPNPILKNIVLIDTPGLNSPFAHHDIQAFEAYKEADDSLWIFKYRNVGKQSEINVLKDLKDDGLHPIGVVNMIDESNDDDIKPYLNYEFEKLSGRVRKLIGVSAIEAQDAYNNNDLELLDLSGFPQLLSIIEEVKTDKHSLKKKRFEQSFMKFWSQLNESLEEFIVSDKYLNSIQQIKNDLQDVKKENGIIKKRLTEEESQMKDNNQKIQSNFSKTVYLNDWAKKEDFINLVEAIPELEEWKAFNESYNDLLKASKRLKLDTMEYEHNILNEFGEKIGFSKLLSTPKIVLVKYRFQQRELLNTEKELNKQIKNINKIHAHLLNKKNYIIEKITEYYRNLLIENESTILKKIESENAKLKDANLLSKKLLEDQLRKWDFLLDLQQSMIQVNQYVHNASIIAAFANELPHLKQEQLVEKEIASLNEEINSSPKKDSHEIDIKIQVEIPNELKLLDEVPIYFIHNIRPLVGASAIALVASAFILLKNPISNFASAGKDVLSNENPVDDYYEVSNDEVYHEIYDEVPEEVYQALEQLPGDGREYIGYIDIDNGEIPIYQSPARGYEDTNYLLSPYTSWGVFSETDLYYEIQEDYWVKKEDVEHLFIANLQEYIQYDTAGMATIYPKDNINNEEILVYERANDESSKLGYLGDTEYLVSAFTENGWLKIGENAWVFYDEQSITLDQWSLHNNLSTNINYEPIIRTEDTTSSFIPVFAENNRESAVIGYLENISNVDIYQLPTSKWASIGTNAWIEVDKFLDIDWSFVPEEYGEPIGTLTVDTNALNVRELDYQESNLLGILPKGTIVNVYEVSNSTGWYRIGTQGWVSEDPDYSTFTKYYEAFPTGESVIGLAEVLVDLHVRQNDHTEAESQGILKKGTIVEVYEISSETGWYRIGYDAWISNNGKVVTYEDYEWSEY